MTRRSRTSSERSGPSDMPLLEPERGRLDLEITLESIEDENVRQVVEKIRTAAERTLFHWRSFPIHLPISIVDSKGFCLKNLFILPTFDELDALTIDCKGNQKYLSHNQLQSVKRKGQFSVTSVNFPGQDHVWKLSPFLQKGIDTAREEYLDGLAFALRFVTVYSAKLIKGDDTFSVKDAVRQIQANVVEIIDLLIGAGRVHSPNLERRIQDERCKFLVAELKCKGDGAKEIGRYVRNQANKAMREKVTMAMERPPPIPYKFITPVSLEVDLRLFDRDLFRKVSPALMRILERSSRGWFLSFREKVITDLKNRKLTDYETEMEANILVMDEYLKRVYMAVRSSDEILQSGIDVDKLLIEQAHVNVLMHRAVDSVSLKMDGVLRDVKKFLVGDHPIASRDPVWMKTQMESARRKFCEGSKWLPHEIALEYCKQNVLKQHSYFLGRDLVFMRDTEPILRKELQADKVPCKVFAWKARIWRPENYVITRTLHGQTDVIPTVISGVTTSITSPRTDAYHPVFAVNQTWTRVSTTRWPLWRVGNYFLRCFTWILNVMFFLGYVVPWCSPIGIRALLYKKPFLPELELSQVNGTLCPKKSSVTPTLMSRLLSIWRKVSKARSRFETQSDTGFLGKGGNRFLNQLWNYVFKGGIPSLLLVLLFPVVSIAASIASVILAVSAFLWVPFAVLVFHLFCVTVYDFDCPKTDRSPVCPMLLTLVTLFVQGISQLVICALGAFIVCPFVTASVALWTAVTYVVRLGWDSLMFYVVIKPKGRLPAGNSWIVKRIMGPGLAPEYYFEISPQQALLALQARLEVEELTIYHMKLNALINQPQTEFKQFFQACLQPFSAKLMETEGRYSDLIRETAAIRSNLDEKVMKRRRDLETGLNVATRSKIRMRKVQLERTIVGACKIAKSFYNDRIFPKMSDDERKQFWENRGLDTNDWMNLCIVLLSEIFCQDFLTPLDDEDVSFHLKMSTKSNHFPMDEFLNGYDKDYWLGETPATMSKIKYQIHSPFLDITAFNPIAKSPYINEYKLAANLCIPLPVLHPAYISVIIHNRETENPFTIDNPICQAILRALQDSGPMLNQDCISIDCESSISSSEETNARSTPTREDIIGIDSPSPMSFGQHQQNLINMNSQRSSNNMLGGTKSVSLIGSGSSVNSHMCQPSPSSPAMNRISSGSSGRNKVRRGSSADSAPMSHMFERARNPTSAHENGVASKASLASPETINLEDVVLSTYGTSV